MITKTSLLRIISNKLIVKTDVSNISKFNLFLGMIFALYVLCASKYIGNKDSIFYSNYYKLFLLIGVLVIYPYHKQAGVILLIIVMVTHLPIFREQFESFIGSTTTIPTITSIPTLNIQPSSFELTPNKLENQESNYDLSIEKRKALVIDKKIEDEQSRLKLLNKENLITPLEGEIISEIQRQFDDEIDLITTDDFEKIAKYTDEGDPINAGLLPKIIDNKKNNIDYNQLIMSGKVIMF